MRPLAASLMLVLVAASGCLGGDDPPAAAPPGPDAEGDAPDGASRAPAQGPTARATPDDPKPNGAPIATLEASNTTGDVPLTITFVVRAQDPDDDRLFWALDVDDDGRADATGDTLPANVTWTFWDAGNHTVLLTVDDGQTNTTASVVIGATTPPPPQLPAPKRFQGTLTGAWVGADAHGGPAYVGQSGTHRFNFTEYIRVVDLMIVTVRGTNVTALDFDFEVTTPDGTLLARLADDDPTAMSTEGPLIVTDPTMLTMTGDWTLTVRPGFAVSGPYEAVVTFE